MTLMTLLCLSFAPALQAHAQPLQAQVAAAGLHDLVRDQLAAFDRGDAQEAWSIVSPDLRERFRTPEGFLEMVRIGYAPLVHSQRVVFGEQVRLPSGETGQWLDVTGPDGERVRALYLFEQLDGAWVTTGCLLFEPEDLPPRA